MKIRFAEKKDIHNIIKLCELHAIYEKAAFKATNKASLLSNYLFDNKDVLQCLVVEKDEEIIGYATFMKQFSTWDTCFYLYLDCLFFLDTFRGKGLGTLLMNKVKVYAKKKTALIFNGKLLILIPKQFSFIKK